MHIWSTIKLESTYPWDIFEQLLFTLLYEWDGVNPYMYSDGTSMASADCKISTTSARRGGASALPVAGQISAIVSAVSPT